MSEYIDLPDKLVVDPRLLFGSRKEAIIRKGAAQVTPNRTTAASVSNSQVTFNISLNNSALTVIDPYCYVEVPIRVTISSTGTSQTVKSYLANNFSLRQYPLASVTSVATVTINQSSLSVSPNEWIHQLSLFQDFISGKGDAALQSICPIMPDQTPQYNDTVGSLKRPMNSYLAGGEHYSSPRGEFNALFEDVTSTGNTWVFTTTIREPIFHPMLEYDPSKPSEAIPYVNLMTIQLTFLSYLERMFSYDAVACPNITGIDVQILSATLVQQWLTVPPSLAMPEKCLRSFNNLSTYTTSQTPMTAGQQQTLYSQSISFSQLPKKIWLYVNESQSSTNVPFGSAKSDFCFAIDNVSITFNNNSSVLGSFNSSDLYNSCVAQEGCKLTYVQTRKFTGAVICIDPVKLFNLPDDFTAGIIGNFQFKAQVQCTNISSSTIYPTLYIVTALDTVLIIPKSGQSSIVSGFITENDVRRASSLPAYPMEFSHDDVFGGSWWDRIKNIGKSVFNFIKDNKLLSKGLSMIPQTAAYAPIADSLGLGQGGKRTNKSMMIRALRN